MNETVSSEVVRSFILEVVRDRLAGNGIAPVDVSPTFDLLLEGVIDSLGLVEIVTRLEGEYSVVFDFDELDVDDLTRIGPLADYVAGLAGR